MAIETKDKQIGEHNYRVTAFGALQGRVILARLTNLIGPVIRSFKDVANDLAEGKDVDKVGAMVEAVAQAAEKLPPKEFADLCDAFANQTVVDFGDGRELPLAKIFDLHFSARYMDLLEWFAFVVEVNFASFFTGPNIGKLQERLTQKQGKREQA